MGPFSPVSEQEHRRRSLSAAWVLLVFCLVALLGMVGGAPSGLVETTRNWLFDSYQRFLPSPTHAPSQCVVIDIDSESIRRIGQWPWPRDRLAALVDAADGARAIGIDIILAEPDRMSPDIWAANRTDLSPEMRQSLERLPSTDAVLATAIGRSAVVLGTPAMPDLPVPAEIGNGTTPVVPIRETGEDVRPMLPHFAALVRPLSVLLKASRGFGIVSVTPEPDGVLRRVPTVFNVDSALMPSLALQLARVAAGADGIIVRGDTAGLAEIVFGDRVVRSDAAGRVWPRYTTAALPIDIPAYRVLQGAVDPSIFRDHIVLIGASAQGLGDYMVTPLRRATSGVMIQARLVDSFLSGDMLWHPPWATALELLAAALFAAAGALLFGGLSGRLYIGLCSALIAGFVIASLAVYEGFGLLIDWTFPLAALVLTSAFAFALRARVELSMRKRREAELAAALVQARAADRAKSEFLANCSHELRTPLNAIIGFSEVMIEETMGPLSKTYAGYARDIHRSGAHLLAIIGDVLDLSLLDLGGRSPRDDVIDVAEALDQSVKLAAMRLEGQRVAVIRDIAPDLPALCADAEMFNQMVINLLSNAFKYSSAGGTVTIRAYCDDGCLSVSVTDHGPGIAASDIPYALQRFGRLQSANLAQQPGVGIGLPLTKSLVEMHGGALELKSELGVGTTAILHFPAARLITKEHHEAQHIDDGVARTAPGAAAHMG